MYNVAVIQRITIKRRHQSFRGLYKNRCIAEGNWVFAINSNLVIPIFLQPEGNLWYFKFRSSYPSNIIDWHIYIFRFFELFEKKTQGKGGWTPPPIGIWSKKVKYLLKELELFLISSKITWDVSVSIP